jgi:hypothetical protein
MSRGIRASGGRPAAKVSMSAALFALVAGAISVSTAGCAAIPVLSVIPSVVSFVYNVSTKKSDGDTDTDTAKNQDAQPPAEEEASTPPAKMTADDVCHLMAIARPDLMVVELRKNTSGAPEYRELHLQNSAQDARWTPAVDSETDPGGWRPAVNFLKMDFNPPLTEVIPDSGTCYLAYVPIVVNPNNPNQVPQIGKSDSGDAAGAFSWEGREYQYKVARTLPCLTPSS